MPDCSEALEVFTHPALEFAQINPSDKTADQLAISAAQQWLRRTRSVMESPTSATAPEIKHGRDVTYERSVEEAYLQGLKTAAPQYYSFLDSIREKLPPMNDCCRLAINMPAYREVDTIGDALGHMLIRYTAEGTEELAQLSTDGSALDPTNYELTVATNRPMGVNDDGTYIAVQKFIQSHKLPITVNALDLTLPAAIANNGMARRILHDITFMRSLTRRKQLEPLYIAAEDADIKGYDRGAFNAYITALDENLDWSAVRLRTERDPSIMSQVPHLLIKHRFMTMVVSAIRSRAFGPKANPNYSFRFNRPVPSGYGTAYVSSDLIHAGGFPIVEASGDLLLGDHLAVLHETADLSKDVNLHRVVGGRPQYVVSSPRRELVAYITGVDAYQGKNFHDMTDLTRLSEDDLVALALTKSSETSRIWLEQQLQYGLERIAATASSDQQAERFARNILTILGFTSEVYKLSVRDRHATITVKYWGAIEELAQSYHPSSRLKECYFS